MTEDGYDTRVDRQSEPIVRDAWRGGVAAPVTITWRRWHEHPAAPAQFDLDIEGPFGVVNGRADDLFLALQQARHAADGGGWTVAVEGARPEVRPASQQPEGLQGSNVVRAGETPEVVRDLLDPATPDVVAPALAQRRRRDAWPLDERAQPTWSAGRDYRVFNADVRDQRTLWWGASNNSSGSGHPDRAVFTERLFAGFAPQRTTLAEVQEVNRFRQVRVDPGTEREYARYPFPAPLRWMPARFALGARLEAPVLDDVVPGIRVFSMAMRGRIAQLAVLPRRVDYDDIVTPLEDRIGSAIFDPMVFMRDGALRRTVRAAIREQKEGS